MAITLEYALLSGAAYRSTRTPINRFPVPNAYRWGEILYLNLPDSGFKAIALQKGTEIVISFAGTADLWKLARHRSNLPPAANASTFTHARSAA
jgi:hypothetical protein